jgi:hypothetical protein
VEREEAIQLLLGLVEMGGLRGRAAIIRETVAFIRNLDGEHTPTREYQQRLRRIRKDEKNNAPKFRHGNRTKGVRVLRKLDEVEFPV